MSLSQDAVRIDIKCLNERVRKRAVNMKFKISNDTIRNTTKCKGNFSCLEGNEECLCSIDDCSDGTIHFVTPGSNDLHCDYKTPFGYSFTCTCPVRKEIYNIYRV